VLTPPGFARSIEAARTRLRPTSPPEDLLTGHKVKVLLYNSQATSPVTESIKALAGAVRRARGRRVGDDAGQGAADSSTGSWPSSTRSNLRSEVANEHRR
jgi:hypothetical protein